MKEGEKAAFERPSSPSAQLMDRLEITALKEARRELEAKVARMQASTIYQRGMRSAVATYFIHLIHVCVINTCV